MSEAGRRRVGRVSWVLLGTWMVCLSGACAGKQSTKSDSTAPPSEPNRRNDAGRAIIKDRATRDGQALDNDTLADLEAELAQAEHDLGAVDAVGESVPANDDAAPQPARPDRCERIEALAEQICDIRDRVCTLADEHPTAPRYQDVCGRAETSCGEAAAARDTCEL